jgi:hypothetical protein
MSDADVWDPDGKACSELRTPGIVVHHGGGAGEEILECAEQEPVLGWQC